MLGSVVIPAHNEARSIGRLLDALLADDAGEFEVVVVCNGCSDDTAAIARRRGDAVRVIELERPSKHGALREGDRVAITFPRLYVDGDVELSAASARLLAAALSRPGTLAAAPERHLVVSKSSLAVRSYYRVWSRLPVVRDGLFGRGVLGVSAEGYARINDRPEVLGDDLYAHSRFAPSERQIVPGSTSTVYAPRVLGDLVRRRTRAAQGNSQLVTSGEASSTSAGSARDLVRLVRADPKLAVHVPTFLAVTVLARLKGARMRASGQDGVWLRDESSRT